MIFEWDERKREVTLSERALVFVDAPLFFDGRPVIVLPSSRAGEERWKTIAEIEGAYYALVWMWRGEAVRVISMRRAHGDEEDAYRAIYDG